MSLDPSMALDMVKGTFTNVLPMIAIGGWINWTFSGFLASELFMDNGWIDIQIDGINGWIDRWMKGRIDIWMDRLIGLMDE